MKLFALAFVLFAIAFTGCGDNEKGYRPQDMNTPNFTELAPFGSVIPTPFLTDVFVPDAAVETPDAAEVAQVDSGEPVTEPDAEVLPVDAGELTADSGGPTSDPDAAPPECVTALDCSPAENCIAGHCVCNGEHDPECGKDGRKSLLCHVPKGNMDNEHDICVGNPSVPAHFDHGDYLGPCK